MKAIKPYGSTFSISALLLFMAISVPSAATIILEGSDQEKIELQSIIDAYKNGSPQAQAIVAELEKAESGNVTVKFGNTEDLATADPANKVITLNKAAIAAMTQIDKPGGGGKALEQMGMPYLFGHEALHILNPNHTEDQVVSKNNEVRVEKDSSKRTKYKANKVGGMVFLPFDDGSFVDLTESFKISAGNGGSPGVAIFQEANSLNLSATQQESGAIALTLDSSAGDQYMTLNMPNELGGGGVSVKLMELSAMLTWSSSQDFSLATTNFHMKFDEFDLGGVSTGINIISPYLDHQTPYGYWEWLSDGSFMFDFSGDLGWTNALFGPEDMALAVESVTGNMLLTAESVADNLFLSANNQWLGTGNLSGAKFTSKVPEPSSILLLLIGSLFILVFRHPKGIATADSFTLT